jgi:hypothetical protein
MSFEPILCDVANPSSSPLPLFHLWFVPPIPLPPIILCVSTSSLLLSAISHPLVSPSVSTPPPPYEQLLAVAAAVGAGLWWHPGGPSHCPHPCHSLFPPHEQLLMAAVGGAMVVVVVVAVIVAMVVVTSW